MLDQHLKKKREETIHDYEQKCHRLEVEIKDLRSALAELTTLPSGIHLDLDKHLITLKDALKDKKDSRLIRGEVNSLVDVISNLKSSKEERSSLMTGLIKQYLSILHPILSDGDERTVHRLNQELRTAGNEKKLIVEFTNLLTSIVKTQREGNQQSWKNEKNTASENIIIDSKINAALIHLLENLPANNTTSKFDLLKTSLEEKISLTMLSEVIENLTDIVINSFGFEQQRFREFLYEFSDLIHDFGQCLKSFVDTDNQTKKGVKELQQRVEFNLNLLAKEVQDLNNTHGISFKTNEHLKQVNRHIDDFKEQEKNRLEYFDNKLMILQDKLMETEKHVQEIKKILSFEKLRSNQDSLTGLPNRVAYEEHLLEAYQRWKRGFGDLSFVMMDVDHGNLINKNHGYHAGNDIIKKIAQILKSTIREVDFIARYGSQKFVFIFEKTNIHNATKIAEGLRNAIEETKFDYHGEPIDVTVSLGLTCLKQEDSLETMFVRAEEAMLQAKDEGRNRLLVL